MPGYKKMKITIVIEDGLTLHHHGYSSRFRQILKNAGFKVEAHKKDKISTLVATDE